MEQLIPSKYDITSKNLQALPGEIKFLIQQCNVIGTNGDDSRFRQSLMDRMKSIQSLVFGIRHTLQDAEREGLLRQQKWHKLNQQFESDYKKIQNVSSSIRTKLKKTALRRSMDAQSDNDQLLRGNGIMGNGYGSTSDGQQQQEEVIFKEYTDDFHEMENLEEQIFDILDNLQELNQAQRDLNDLVQEMEEPIQMLVDNTYAAKENVWQGVDNIETASKHLRAYRGKLCCVLVSLLIIGIIVTIIIVVTHKK